MQTQKLITNMSEIVEKRLGGNLRLFGVYGSGADAAQATSDLDFILVCDYAENCVTYATRECRDLFPSVQFFVVTAQEYALLPRYYKFQFAFAKKLVGDLELPQPTREDAIESIEHGFIDTLRTLRQQFKRREWTIADDWARQTWWNLKSFKYALMDTCWLIRGSRTRDIEAASLILLSEGLNSSASAILDWPKTLDVAAQQLTHDPLIWVTKWEARINASYSEVRPYLTLGTV
jgi:hypothetical protein